MIPPPTGAAAALGSPSRWRATKFRQAKAYSCHDAPNGKQGKIHSAQSHIQRLARLLEAPRRSYSEQFAHESPQIVRRCCHQVALVNFADPLQPSSPRSAGLTHMGERPFYLFASLALQSFAAHTAYASSVCIY